jgi:hypothetical protein
MSEVPQVTPGAMLFECNEALVFEAFRSGEFDYVDGIGEVSEADFFRAITEWRILTKLAESYPSLRERHDDPCAYKSPAIYRYVSTARITSMRSPSWCVRAA